MYFDSHKEKGSPITGPNTAALPPATPTLELNVGEVETEAPSPGAARPGDPTGGGKSGVGALLHGSRPSYVEAARGSSRKLAVMLFVLLFPPRKPFARELDAPIR